MLEFDRPEVITQLWEFRKGIRLGPAVGFAGYEIATLPPASGRDGTLVWVSDGGASDASGALYVAKGTEWREVDLV